MMRGRRKYNKNSRKTNETDYKDPHASYMDL